jgi:hypothetical protein
LVTITGFAHIHFGISNVIKEFFKPETPDGFGILLLPASLTKFKSEKLKKHRGKMKFIKGTNGTGRNFVPDKAGFA